MKKRILGLTASALMIAAVLTGCGDKKKVDLSDLKGTYTLSEYGSWGGDDYPDCDSIAQSLYTDPMEISKSGKLHFDGKEYRLSSKGKRNGMTVFSVRGSGFGFDRKNDSGIEVDDDYTGPAYITVESEIMLVNDKECLSNTCSLYYTAKGDEQCSAFFTFIPMVNVDN